MFKNISKYRYIRGIRIHAKEYVPNIKREIPINQEAIKPSRGFKDSFKKSINNLPGT
jgi:hypothetical protein